MLRREKINRINDGQSHEAEIARATIINNTRIYRAIRNTLGAVAIMGGALSASVPSTGFDHISSKENHKDYSNLGFTLVATSLAGAMANKRRFLTRNSKAINEYIYSRQKPGIVDPMFLNDATCVELSVDDSGEMIEKKKIDYGLFSSVSNVPNNFITYAVPCITNGELWSGTYVGSRLYFNESLPNSARLASIVFALGSISIGSCMHYKDKKNTDKTLDSLNQIIDAYESGIGFTA